MTVNNTLRAVATIAVLGIHVLAAQHSQNYGLNIIFRFSVPLFVALSGFGLAKSFAKKPNLVDFYFRRTVRLLPWYLFWGVIIYLYLYRTLPNWIHFVLGNIDYQMYFVPMIIKLYLLFPLLFWLVKKFPWPVLTIAFLWQIYQYYGFNATTLSDQQQYVMAGSWIFYFVLGIFLALRPKILSYYPAALLTGFGLIWSLLQINPNIDPIIFTRFTQIPVLIYATGFILMSFFMANLLSYYPTILLSLGELSYIIYLHHTLVLRFLPISLPYPILLTLLVLVSAAIAWLVQNLFRQVWLLLSRLIPPDSA